jgi:DNA segregation ATPase FtsK/SpoIIIE, S-DNA-T family
LSAVPAAPPTSARIWLGAPNSIKGPTEAVFHRQSGNHLIIIGQREEAAAGMLGLALVSLAAQYPKGAVRFVLFEGDPQGSPARDFLERVVKVIPHEVRVARANDLGEIMNGLAEELKKRSGGEAEAVGPTVFLLFHNLQKINKLRHEEDFSFSAEATEADPGKQLSEIISEGAGHGMHVMATFDTYNNVNRSFTRKSLSEFEMRVLFQMSVNDSASLIDNPKASMLGLHRALFYNEQEGYLETFRPYALPDDAWMEGAAKQLQR